MSNQYLVWAMPLLAVIIAGSASFERPRWFWRPITARASEASPGWWLVFAMPAGWSLAAASWFALRILGRTPVEGTPSMWSVFDHAFGFFKRGFTGTLADQADMQAAVIWGALAVTLSRLAVRMRHAMFELEIDPLPMAEARRVIVVGLSDPGPEAPTNIQKLGAMGLKSASTADVGRFGWQQSLRVLKHHWDRGPIKTRRMWFWSRAADDQIRHVVVLPSPQTAPHFAAFKELAEKCLAQDAQSNAQFHCWPHAVDYDDLVALQGRFRSIVRWARTDPKVAATLDDISIDTTAGFKVFSIAGATATFTNPIEFTYVRTNAPFDVQAYDVRAIYRTRKVTPSG